MWIALIIGLSTASVRQESIPCIEALPNQPNNWAVPDYRGQAETLQHWLFNETSVATFNRTFDSHYYSGAIVSLPSYLGDPKPSIGPGEGVAVIGTVYASALIGLSGLNVSHEHEPIRPEFITIYSDVNGIVWNDPIHAGQFSDLPTFWYGLVNSFLLYGSMDVLDMHVRHEMLQKAVLAWTRASDVMDGDYNHTGFNFSNLTPVDNGEWTEGDTAGGVALIGLWGAQDALDIAHAAELQASSADVQSIRDAAVAAAAAAHKDAAAGIALAKTALDFLERQTVSPLWECIMAQGVLAAARMNAFLQKDAYNVSKMLEFTLSNGNNQYRLGWGMLAGGTRWGGYDVGGLAGSLTDGGGYAFAGNGIWNFAALAPIPRYQPQYTRIIAKWAYNLLSNSKYFNSETPAVGGKQSNPDDKWDFHNVVMYEGLRKCDFDRTIQKCRHGDDFGPFATGDWCELLNCTHVSNQTCGYGDDTAPCSDRSDRALYGGGLVGVYGSVATKTNESSVIQLDVLATDHYAQKFDPTFIYYNPLSTKPVWVHISSSKCAHDKLYDIFDLVSEKMLSSGIDCSIQGDEEGKARTTVKIAPDTAMLLEIRLASPTAPPRIRGQ